MRSGQASRTAEHNALFRALETSLPPERRLFSDPLARAFVTWPLSLAVRAGAVPGGREVVLGTIDRRWPGVRTSVVARTKLIDEDLATSARSRPQVVILGAGYDTRAHRLDALRQVAVFEVDHPDTQAAKRAVLRRVGEGGGDGGGEGGGGAENVRYVASDFNQSQLEPAMEAAGHDMDRPTVFVWEGVTGYLTEAAVDTTLRWCARAAPGSRLIFTYLHRDVLTDPQRFAGTERLLATLDKVGERLTFGMDPAAVAGYLAQRGLTLQRDLGAAEYRELAYGDRARDMHGHEFYRVAFATVGAAVPGPAARDVRSLRG
ncbi:MAG: class I SAM-dependent methyltransferase [Acidimicrobiales bacterium]